MTQRINLTIDEALLQEVYDSMAVRQTVPEAIRVLIKEALEARKQEGEKA